MKDANQTFIDFCKGDITTFRDLVTELSTKAKSNLMPGVSNLRETFKSAQRVNTQDSPFRWRWPWVGMDGMANIMPGSVVYLSATNTGMGKTTLMMDASLFNARRGEVILNYSAELNDQEYAQIAVSHLLKKDRHELTKEDYDKAYLLLAGSRYFIGRNNDLNKVTDVLDLIEAAIRRSSAGTVILDTIHFVTTNESDTVKAQENAMNRIKSMAQKYSVKWFNLGQPRKATQQTKGKATHITDAKGSEMLISASDVAYTIHRDCARVDDPNNPPKEPYEPICQIFLQKGRSLGTGGAYTELMFNGDICTFFDISKAPQDSKLFKGEE
jgi:replicative DNA helicase